MNFLLVLSNFILLAFCCTNFLVTPGASDNNASMITYNTDSHQSYGYLARYPAADYQTGTMLPIYDWETGQYLGQIPQVAHTYSVVGNMNEFQLVIGETTFGGLSALGSQPGGIIDYGSLIYITLQRARNAREAIQVMTSLTQTYGYASEGESFSIGDPNEVWILEMIGKGKFEKGTVWAARLIPDGYVCAHANQARITTLPANDPNTIYSADVVSFAKANGFYPQNMPDSQFSFSDTYNPLSFEGARACEARVWSFFSKITSGMEQYLDYAQGYNLTNRMPLWVRPTQQLDLKLVIKLMRDHFEGTWFDFRNDVGAQAFNYPYRWRPLEFTSNGKHYVNERAISTQQTANTFVSQSRGYLPDMIGGVLWFGVDDSALTIHSPMYCGITNIPKSLDENGRANLMEFSFDSAFWVFNLVSNYVYSRYRIIYPEVIDNINRIESDIMDQVKVIESKVQIMIKSGQTAEATKLITSYSVDTYQSLVTYWLKYFQYLFVKYMDGNVKTPTGNPKQPNVNQPGYGQSWYDRIANETGTRYQVPPFQGRVSHRQRNDPNLPRRKL